MDSVLNQVEVRVLGSLIEKEITTPEYYPLTLNALVNACNQKSNRDPVVAFDDDTVARAVDSLRSRGFASELTGVGMRVPKYRELAAEALSLGRRELALVCVLMLRGPQTLGELRDRTERLHTFSDLEEVESVLQHLIDRDAGALVVRLPRQPGTKESRYAHLLAGAEVLAEPAARPAVSSAPPQGDRFEALEAEVRQLREDVRRLEDVIVKFRAQFE